MIGRTQTIVITAAFGMMLAGGCGPTKEGIKARADANARLNAFTTQMSYENAVRAFETGQFDRAMKEVNGAIQVVPEAPEYHVLKGRILMERGRLQAAIQSFETALELNPQLADAHYYSGAVFQRWSDDEAAYEAYASAWEIDESQVHYLLAAAESLVEMGDLRAAEAMIEPRLSFFEHNSAMRHLLGNIALLEGDAEKGARLLSEARLLNPDDESLHEELTRALFEAGDYGRCLDSVESLLQDSEEERTDLVLLQARCLTMLERFSEARDQYLILSQSDPANAEIWIELGMLSWDMGDWRRVAQCSVRVIGLSPRRYEGYLLKGMHERHLGRDAEALDLLQKAAELAPDNVVPHLLLGLTYEKMHDYAAAAGAVSTALRIDPDNAKAQAMISRINTVQQIAAVETD